MATSIEQIFRSFVVSKFREIQEQQFGSAKLGSQHNGEINSSEQVNSSDDTITSIGNLQNDPLVQKIEQVLSEVLSAESQYKPDGGEDTVRNKSHSTKRGLSEEVEDEIPRKKSKKDKKHKDKKKKKKRKKEKREKKYKKQPKESKLNEQHKECGDTQSISHSKSESSSSVPSAEDVDLQPVSSSKQTSGWLLEKTVCENLNLATSNSHNANNSVNSKLDTTRDSTLANIQELHEVKLTNERELENNTYQPTNVALNLCIGNESLNIADVEGRVANIKEYKQPEASLTLEAMEETSAPESSPKSVAVQLEYLETSSASDTMEVKDLDSVSESFNPEILKQAVATSFETAGCNFTNLPSEAAAEAKDSVTTLGFLAMVVGKDFEATSEFLNTAKVKASEISPDQATFMDMKEDLLHDSESIVTVKDLQLSQQLESTAALKDLEAASESLHTISEKYFEPAVVTKLKHHQEELKIITELDAQKCTAATPDVETRAGVKELGAAQASPVQTTLNDAEKHQMLLQTVADAKDAPELEDMKSTDSTLKVRTMEVGEMDMRCLKAKSKRITEMGKWIAVPEPLRMKGVKNLDSSPEFEGDRQVNYLGTPLETVVGKSGASGITEDSEAAIDVQVPESISQSEAVLNINNLEMAPEIVKTQYLEASKHVDVRESNTVGNVKDFGRVPESLMTVKNLDSISESQYTKEMKSAKDIFRLDAVTQRKDLETSLETEEEQEEREMDATSDSLHMIFTNYSEQSLEPDTESEIMMKLKSSENVPESLHMVDANKFEALQTGEIQGIKTVDPETIVELNDLRKKLKPLDREVKNMEVTSVPPGKYSEIPVASETVAKSKSTETESHPVPRIQEKPSDAIAHMEKNQNGAEAADLKTLPRYQKLTKEVAVGISDHKLRAESEGSLLISKSLQEMDIVSSEGIPELEDVAVIQELKETTVVDVSRPKEPLALKNLPSIPDSHAEQNLEQLQYVKTKIRGVGLDSLYSLEVKYAGTSPEFLFSEELTSQEEKQKLEERTESRGFTDPESLCVSEKEKIIVLESDEINKVIDLEHSPESMHVTETFSKTTLTPFYLIQAKDSKTASESTIIDLEADLESTVQAGIEIANDPPKRELLLGSILEIASEPPHHNEMSRCTPVLQVSDAEPRSEALAGTDLEADSETVCVIDTAEFEVKKPEMALATLFVPDALDIKATPSFLHGTDDKGLKAAKTIEMVVDIEKLKASSESVHVLKDTFEPIRITGVKDLETSRKVETNLAFLDKNEMNNVLTSTPKSDVTGSETFERCKPVLGAHISEGTLTTADKAEQKDFGVLKPDTKLAVKYSESISKSATVSERKDSDKTQSVFMLDVIDSGASSSTLDTRRMKNSEAAMQFETTTSKLCVPQVRDSDGAVESISIPEAETKYLGKALNYETVLEIKNSVATAAQLNTPELKSSESVSVLKLVDSTGTRELEITPRNLGTANSDSGTITGTEVLEIIGSQKHSKAESTLEVKYLESASETEYAPETHQCKAAPESESVMKEKVSETTSAVVGLVNKEDLETIAKSKHAQEKTYLETLPQSLCTMEASDLEGSGTCEEVLHVSKTTPQFSSIVEEKSSGATISSLATETANDSEKQLELQMRFDETCSRTALERTENDSEPTVEIASIVDGKSSEANAGLMNIVELKDTESLLKSKIAPESIHSKEPEDFEATTKCDSIGKVKDLQVAQTTMGKEKQMDFEGISKSVLALGTQDLERNSTPILLSEKKISEASLKSADALSTKDSVPAPMTAENIDITEQNSKVRCMAEVIDLESTTEQQAKNSEMIPQFTVEAKTSEATSEPLHKPKEKDLDGMKQVSLEEQGLKAAIKSVSAAAENLKSNQQLLKDSEASLEPLQMAKEKELEVTLQDSLKDQDSDTAPKSSDIMKEKEENILKDKKSEKVSSKSKDKSKSGKKAKRSRSKSPSKSKKRKKKSRSRSTSRQVASRRARSRSKNDSRSRKKDSTSRHKSRSKSSDKKESKESSVRSRRRRSRTSDRLKSRSKSVDKRETSVRSRRRRSRSSDHHKSRSRSVDRRESVRRRRRLSRSSDNHKSRSRSVDKRDSLIRSRRRQSRSSDRRKSRSRSTDKRDTSVRTRRRRSRSSDRCKSRSKSVDRRESSVRTRRRKSISSDRHKSRSRSADDKRKTSVRSRRRRSRSPDVRKSRSRSVDRREISVRTRRRRSRSSDRKSRSRSNERRESSVRVRRRRSRSSDNRKSRSRSVDKRDTSLRVRRRRSRSSDRKSRSKSVDKRESSLRTRRRKSVSSDRKSRSKSVDKRETSSRGKRRRSRSADNRKSRSRSVDKRDTSIRAKRRRSRSSDNRKSRSKSAENLETSSRSKRRRSKSADNKCRTKSTEKEDPSLKSRHRKSKSKSKSRSKSPERRKDKDSSDVSGRKRSKSRSKSKSLEKTEGTESVEAPNHTKSPEYHKSKSRSKSLEKTGERDPLRRSRSKGSKSSEPSRRHRTASRSRKNRSRSATRKRSSRSKSDHRSQTRSRSRSRSCSRRWRRTRSRSVSRQRSLSRERRRRSRRNRSRSIDRRRRRSDSRDSYRIPLRLRSRSRTPVRPRCSRSTGRRRSTSISPDHRRSRTSSRSPKRLTDLDKAQLLEIAKANAAAMCAKAGVPLPPSLMPVVTPEKKEEKVAQKSAKETILELTEKCKKIAQSQEDDIIVNKPHVSDEEEEEHPFINHPFKLNEPKPIFFNLTTPTIKPAAPKNQVTLTKEFPVSSGSQHRKKESDSAYGEWVPVEKNKDENKDDVFPNPANLEPVDISSALTERTIAQKRLTENTFDMEAMCLLNRAQERIDAWAQLNSIPGHFTGSTGAQVLSSEQLSNSGPQAWIKKDQFLRAAPVTGGMGAQLMRKMGWREGEGLGKNKEGNKEPILVDFKTDRKGLVAVGEKTQKRHGPFSAVKDLSGKHPVSALLEVCNKRRWLPPIFALVNDNRPEHNKHFLFKVLVNGIEYKPNSVSPNKKHAKAMAATVALQALGLVPKELLANATSFRSASHN
ncbi:protein SON isoform X1 [Podarcis lilfordi]|uniref:Protein SON isoform X1 n=1 Tax=Podarcis lilfordi TaxID=74358 RepID=A0AA35P4I5_9SAUR|nr:protein SON isoform X1 [Podarcis lilfordi]